MIKSVVLTVFLMTAVLSAIPLEKELDLGKGKTISIALTSGGTVRITGWEKDKVSVKFESSDYDLNESDLRIHSNSDGVDISAPQMHGSHGDFKLFLNVPNESDIEIETMGGDLEISDVNGKFSGRTMGGDLEFSNLKGEIDITTMGGDIRVKNSHLDGNLKTMGGDVSFDNVEGKVKGTTMGGDVNYRNARTEAGPGSGSEVNISTMGGDIDVDEAYQGADVHTMGGDITIKKAAQFVVAKTMGGDIDIREIDGYIKASTMGGDIEATMTGDPEKGKRNVEITSKGGEIMLTLPEGFSGDFDIRLIYTKNSLRNYRIKSDFELKIEESPDWEYSEGTPRKTINGVSAASGGKHHVYIETINGNITIRKGAK